MPIEYKNTENSESEFKVISPRSGCLWVKCESLKNPWYIKIIVLATRFFMPYSSTERDIVIVNTLRANLRQENRGIANFIESLLELNASRGWARLGFSSLHDFCTRDLGLSDAEAATRIRVAYLSQSIPDLLPALAESRISITGIRILAPILNADNFLDTLKKVQGYSTRDLEAFRAKMLPAAEHATRGSIRVMGVLGQTNAAAVMKTERPATQENQVNLSNQNDSSCQRSSPSVDIFRNENSHVQRPQIPVVKKEVLPTVTEVRIALNLQDDVWKKFQRVCDLSNHACSGNQLSAVIETLVDDYLKHHDPSQKKAKAAKSRKRVLIKRSKFENNDKIIDEGACLNADSKAGENVLIPKPTSKIDNSFMQGEERSLEEKDTRYIPQKTRREVSTRDEGRCSFVDSTTGRRCSCTRGLQYDHIVPFAKGGSSRDSGNIRLLCRTHNLLAVEAVFGTAFMQKKIGALQQRSKAPVPSLLFEKNG